MEEYRVRQEEFQAARDRRRPSVLYRPSLFMDGDQWCALYGNDLQEGLAGFGPTPAKAMESFDENWEGGTQNTQNVEEPLNWEELKKVIKELEEKSPNRRGLSGYSTLCPSTFIVDMEEIKRALRKL